MESVAANFEIFVIRVRDAVEESLARHCLVESRVEYSELRKSWENFFSDFHTGGVRPFVLRGKKNDTANVVNQFLCHGFGLDVFSTVNDAMANSFDSVDEFLCGQKFLNFDDGFLVGWAIKMKFRFSFGTFGFEVPVYADVFHESA